MTYGARLGFGLFKGRISAEIDAYRRRSYDLVGPIYTQSLGGVAQKDGNVAELKSSGLQFTLSTVNFKTKTSAGPLASLTSTRRIRSPRS